TIRCPLSKFLHLSFISNNFSPNPFDLVHCDIWGPYHQPSHDGNRFFLTIDDDCTRFTWRLWSDNAKELLTEFHSPKEPCISIDVTFYEDQFPFHSISVDTQPDPFQSLVLPILAKDIIPNNPTPTNTSPKRDLYTVRQTRGDFRK
ncbi:hypothetical protein CR513_11617, partial [Mucuna pruriens]